MKLPWILLSSLVIVTAITVGSVRLASAQMQMQSDNTIQCETCPMKVGEDSLKHFKITDGNGTVHYADCFQCALKLVPKYAQIHIVTYCDYYGPNYPITVDFKQNGKTATINPPTALWIDGGACTANRVALNKTAADALIAKGYSQYTMMMQQQVLPATTNTVLISEAGLKFAPVVTQSPPNQIVPLLLGVGGICVLVIAVIVYKKYSH